jgi:uncharacterized 2Fe-2S/4Fe-4S cluster protein (DUF4445 family)
MKGYTKLIGEKGNIHMENIPDQEEVEYPIREDLWNTESNIVRYTVKNNLHKQIFYEFRFLSANGEWMDDDRETETTWYLDADDEMTICMNNPDRLIGSTESYGEYINDNVFLSGCSSAFLGGDVIAGVMHIEKSRNTEVPERYMFLDLGTNGEMVLKDGERYLATSTACGPAFEGCARKQHAYGNSLLEAIALGRRLEKIHANGTLAEEFLDSGIVIHGIHINSEILQSIMLAKAAVYAGIKCLLKTAGLHARDIDKVYIAGGFGFYLNARDAIDLGMLPQDFMDKLEVVGNASLAGATDLLIHGPLSRDFEVYREKLQVIDLTQTEGFQDSLIDACSFVRLT